MSADTQAGRANVGLANHALEPPGPGPDSLGRARQNGAPRRRCCGRAGSPETPVYTWTVAMEGMAIDLRTGKQHQDGH